MEALICIVEFFGLCFFFWGVFKQNFVNESSLVIKSVDILHQGINKKIQSER